MVYYIVTRRPSSALITVVDKEDDDGDGDGDDKDDDENDGL